MSKRKINRLLFLGVALPLLAVSLAGEEGRSPEWKAFDLSDLASRRADSGRPYLEFLRVPSLNAGLYELGAGSQDRQSPHDRDEVYYVVGGRAKLRVGGDVVAVGPGSVVFVRAGVAHRFEEIGEDLSVLVFFSTGPSD